MTSHRVVWPKQGVAELEPFAPPAPGPGQLLLKTRVSLVSPGTERAFFLGLPNAGTTYPYRPGYSAVGTVEAIGEGAGEWRIGDRVASQAPHASHAVMAAAACVRVPDGVEDEDAVFSVLAMISLQGVRKARIELGEPVVVLGAGLIGLFALEWARLNGGLPTIAVDREPRRLEFARAADAALAPNADLPDRIMRVTDGAGAAVVLEATGQPDAIPLAFSLARPFGRVVLLGSTRGENDGVNFYRDVHKKGLTILGAHNQARPPRDSSPGWWTAADDQRTALAMMARGRLVVRPFVTHRFPWRRAPEAYDLLKRWDVDALGMLLDWRE